MAHGSKVWWNGKEVPESEAKISLFSHALHYGSGAFEGIRVYKQTRGAHAGHGAIFRLEDHIQRLFESCKILGITVPFSETDISKACISICKTNQFAECYLRPIVFIGEGPLGVYPGPTPRIDVALLTWEWGNYLGDKGVNEGAKLKISSYIRPHPNSVMTRGKITGQYSTGFIAKSEAIHLGYDEALMLDPNGYLSEGTGENIFMIKNGVIKTTPLTSILSGITRDSVMTHLKSQGQAVVETSFSRDDLICADEIFLTGTAAEITPVREIDGRLIGRGTSAGKPGPLTKRLQADYQKIVHGELSTEHTKQWLTIIK